jgi:hypothetical protein
MLGVLVVATHAATSIKPSLAPQLLSSSISAACQQLFRDEWPEPEETAWVCAQVIAALPEESVAGSEQLPPQGELRFGADVAYDARFATAEPLAHEGDAQAMQTLGLLLFGGVGGAPRDARASAQWHAAAAAEGNLDALATLGGCVRRGVGAEQREHVGEALIEAAAAAGSAVGLVKLGVLHDEGAGGRASDPWRAAQHFAAAAERGSALGSFHHGWALVHGIGVVRDVEAGLDAWEAAAARAPEDGSEEALFHLYGERGRMSEMRRAVLRPGRCLQTAAALGFDEAVGELRRRKRNRATRLAFDAATKRRSGARFVRNDKARAWTIKDERAETFLDGGQ